LKFGRDAACNCAEAIVVAAGALLYLCLAHPSFASVMTAKEKEIEYRGRKLTLRQFANGWRVEIVTPQHGRLIQTLTFRELAEAIDHAKRIVNADR
jgi:hypothetical protein